MFCKNCGKDIEGNKKFCPNCGTAFSSANKENENHEPPKSSAPIVKKNPIDLKKVLGILAVLAFIGYRIYVSIENNSVESNNAALDSIETGNEQQAISQLQEASNSAISNDTKLASLKNLAYVYETEGQNDQALTTFQEAFKLTKEGSLDYYLVAGEINLLQGSFSSALANLNQAYKMDPNDFQVNNTLAIFYLDLDSSAPAYSDYSKALTYAQKAYSVNNVETSRQNLGIAYFYNDNYDKSISLLSQSNLTQHPFVGMWLGFNYAAKNDVPNAKYYLQQAINAGVDAPQEVYDYLNSH
jgi:tetratricopeptide (TPR) repeat protein